MFQRVLTLLGVYAAPFMMAVLIIDKFRYNVETGVDLGIIIVSIVTLLLLVIVLYRARHTWADKEDTYKQP